jgi:hypothetical protein
MRVVAGMITIRDGLAVFLRPGFRVPRLATAVATGKLTTWKQVAARIAATDPDGAG